MLLPIPTYKLLSIMLLLPITRN